MIITHKELDLVFVTNWYDGPLTGLCRYEGALCYFEAASEAGVYEIRRLGFFARLWWRLEKLAFEICVGGHWSYPSKQDWYYVRSPAWLHHIAMGTYYARSNLRRWVRRKK